MKKILLLLTALCALKLNAQLSFTLAPDACINGTVNLQASTGSLTALGYSWAAVPAGPVFTSTSSPSTSVKFPSAGNFTIVLGIITQAGPVYETHSVVVHPNPTITVIGPNAMCAGFTDTLTAFGASTYTWTGTTLGSPVYQPSVVVGPGAYTVSGTDAFGCEALQIQAIALAPPLAINISASTLVTCITSNNPSFSKSVHLSASGASAYTWLPPGGLSPITSAQIDVRPAAFSCYTVQGWVPGCSGTAAICISVAPQFTILAAAAEPSICLGQTVALSVTQVGAAAAGPPSAFSYSWTEATNVTPSLDSYFGVTVNAFPQLPATYTVEVWDANQCVSLPGLLAVNVGTCLTSVRETSVSETLFSIYPNPAKNALYIQTEQGIKANMTIRDISGEVLLEEKCESHGVLEFSIARLSAGIYFVTLVKEQARPLTKKLIKE